MHQRVAEGAFIDRFETFGKLRPDVRALLQDCKGTRNEPTAAGGRAQSAFAEALAIGRIANTR